MEILQFLTSFFQNNQNMKLLAPIIEILRNNDFDIKRALSSLTPEMIKPIIEEFARQMNYRSNSQPVRNEGLTPISNIADKDIVYSLNRYLSQSESC